MSKAAAKGSVPVKAVKSKTPAASQQMSEVFSAFQLTYNDYVKTLTPRLQLIDTFLAFLVLLGVLQFVYVIVVGDFPFNAFLGGFISCVGQFVLAVLLRLQVVDLPKEEANNYVFGEFVFASLILHFIVFHFIN